MWRGGIRNEVGRGDLCFIHKTHVLISDVIRWVEMGGSSLFLIGSGF